MQDARPDGRMDGSGGGHLNKSLGRALVSFGALMWLQLRLGLAALGEESPTGQSTFLHSIATARLPLREN